MRILLSLLLWFCLPSLVAAQSIWRMPYQPNQIVLETVLPTYDTDRFEGLTGAAYLTGTWSANDNIEAVAELPVARAQTPGQSGTVLGSPYVGLGLVSSEMPLMLEVGARLPLGTDNALAREAATEVTEPGRTRAFLLNERGVSALGNMSVYLSRRTSFRFRAGLVYGASEEADGSIDKNLRFRYAAQWWRIGDRFGAGFTFTGVAELNDRGSYGSNSLHHLGTSLFVRVGPAHVGVVGGLALDSALRDIAPGFVGLTLSTSYDS